MPVCEIGLVPRALLVMFVVDGAGCIGVAVPLADVFTHAVSYC